MMQELSNTFVCIMGMGIVFIGLISIVLLCKIMSFFCQKCSKGKNESVPVQTQSPVNTGKNVTAADKQAIIAGICSVIAEELGADVKNIRVLSFKQTN